MLDLGTVRPGQTIRIPYSTFAGSTGASATQTGFAASDIQIYKDGSTTQRASTSGFTATTDFDSSTGLQMLVIDLADNTTAGFYSAGSEYLVAVADVTIDSQTVRTWVARFKIGHYGAILNTTIATLSSQTSFTLTSGPAEDDALTGCVVVIHDVASAVQMGHGYVTGYTGSTKTVTLAAGTTFTAAATDNISIFPRVNVYGIAGTAQTARDIGASVLLAGDLTSTMKASVATAVLDAFATASDSVQPSPSPTDTAFAGSSSLSSSDDFYNGSVLMFTSGALDGLARKIVDYTGATRLITLSPALPSAPSSSDTFRVLGRID